MKNYFITILYVTCVLIFSASIIDKLQACGTPGGHVELHNSFNVPLLIKKYYDKDGRESKKHLEYRLKIKRGKGMCWKEKIQGRKLELKRMEVFTDDESKRKILEIKVNSIINHGLHAQGNVSVKKNIGKVNVLSTCGGKKDKGNDKLYSYEMNTTCILRIYAQ